MEISLGDNIEYELMIYVLLEENLLYYEAIKRTKVDTLHTRLTAIVAIFVLNEKQDTCLRRIGLRLGTF